MAKLVLIQWEFCPYTKLIYTWIDKDVYRSIRSTGIANIPPTICESKGGAKCVINIIASKPDRRDKTCGKGNNSSNIIHVKIIPHQTEYKDYVIIGLMNCHSVMNKSGQITECIKDIHLDVVPLTKIWLTGIESEQMAEQTSSFIIPYVLIVKQEA